MSQRRTRPHSQAEKSIESQRCCEKHHEAGTLDHEKLGFIVALMEFFEDRRDSLLEVLISRDSRYNAIFTKPSA